MTKYRLRYANGRLRRPFAIALLLAFLLVSATPRVSHAAVWCVLSNFIVDAYDHGGVYLHGNLGGVQVDFLEICGETNGQTDCTTQATDRRVAVALAAQTAGRNLNVYFDSFDTCSQFQPYTRATTIQMLN